MVYFKSQRFLVISLRMRPPQKKETCTFSEIKEVKIYRGILSPRLPMQKIKCKQKDVLDQVLFYNEML